MTGGSALRRIGERLPELASDDVIAAGLEPIRPLLRATMRSRQRALFQRRTGTMIKAIGVVAIHRGLSARVASRAWYATIWNSGRRVFVRPAVEDVATPAADSIARQIEAVTL